MCDMPAGWQRMEWRGTRWVRNIGEGGGTEGSVVRSRVSKENMVRGTLRFYGNPEGSESTATKRFSTKNQPMCENTIKEF